MTHSGPSEPSQAEQSKGNPPIQSTSNLARIQRFKELLRDCFDRHTRVATEPDEEEGKLKLDVVKAYFAKKERKISLF